MNEDNRIKIIEYPEETDIPIPDDYINPDSFIEWVWKYLQKGPEREVRPLCLKKARKYANFKGFKNQTYRESIQFLEEPPVATTSIPANNEFPSRDAILDYIERRRERDREDQELYRWATLTREGLHQSVDPSSDHYAHSIRHDCIQCPGCNNQWRGFRIDFANPSLPTVIFHNTNIALEGITFRRHDKGRYISICCEAELNYPMAQGYLDHLINRRLLHNAGFWVPILSNMRAGE